MIFGNLGNMGEMLKMARDMQSQMKNVKKELSRATFEGQAEGVSVVLNGEFELQKLTIDPVIIQGSGDRVQKRVEEAFKKALKAAKDGAAEKMKAATGGLNLPGMFG